MLEFLACCWVASVLGLVVWLLVEVFRWARVARRGLDEVQAQIDAMDARRE